MNPLKTKWLPQPFEKQIDMGLVVVGVIFFSLSLHPLCGGGDLLFLPSPPAAAAATCFCSHSKSPTRIISKYLQHAYWPWGICLVFFVCVCQFFSTKSKMAAKILWRTLELEHASSICFMFGLKERPYSGGELKSFWCDSDNKNFDIFTF